MHVLAFRHVPFEHPGLILPALEAAGIECRLADLYKEPEATLEWESAAGLLFMGGPMSANDPLTYIEREIAIISRAVSAGLPVLGVCLGAQLIARALGAAVYRNPVKEIGWAPVRWTPDASEDPLLHGLTEAEIVFHWHGETFDLPAGARRLAISDHCKNQAFRYRSNVFALQFHLEVTPEMIADWCAQDVNRGDVAQLVEPIDPHAHFQRMSEISARIFDRWANLIKKSAVRPR